MNIERLLTIARHSMAGLVPEALALPAIPQGSPLTTVIGQSTLAYLGLWMGNPDSLVDEIHFGSSYAEVLDPDQSPPPVPAMVTPLGPVTSSTVTVSANPVVNGEGSGVQYRFFDQTRRMNSGWLDDPVLTNTGLTPQVTYMYTVQSRDTSAGRNESAVSSPEAATTRAYWVICESFSHTVGANIEGTTADKGPSAWDTIVTPASPIAAGSLTYGALPTSGNKYFSTGGSVIAADTTSSLTAEGSLADGSELWMSCILEPQNTNRSVRTALFLGTDADRVQKNMIVDAAANVAGSGGGFYLENGNSLRFLSVQNLATGGAVNRNPIMQSLPVGSSQLVVMQMVWGAGSDTLAVSILGTNSSPLDDIRLGETYADVTGAGGCHNAYATWAATNAPASGWNPSADEDGDGVANGMEFVVRGGVSTDDSGKLPIVSTSETHMTFTFVRGHESIGGSTATLIEVGSDLSSWPDVYTVGSDAVGSTAGGALTDNLNGTDTIFLSVQPGTDGRKFARIKVTAGPLCQGQTVLPSIEHHPTLH